VSSSRQQYQDRFCERQARSQQEDRLHHRVGNARLLAFAALVVLLFFVLNQSVHANWLLLPIAAFAFLVFWHSRLNARWERARRALQFYRDGLDRLDHRWAGRGLKGNGYSNAEHPYLADLDIFGSGSLFEFVCRARTRPGQDCLAAWLTTGAPTSVIQERQQAVQELQDRLDLREDLAVLNFGRGTVTIPSLVAWGQKPALLTSAGLRFLGGILGLCGLGAFVHWIVTWDPIPLAFVIVVQQLFLLALRKSLKIVLREVEPIAADCRSLTLFLQRLERESFRSPLLERLWQPLQGHPSEALKKLEMILDFLEARRNLFVSPVVFVSLATLQWAYEIEGWRKKHGARIEGWMEALAQFEALSSLASLAWENPEYGWPSLEPGGFGLEADDLGHPLLDEQCVGNDIRLRDVGLWMVSGSNMSGKSSLLRALGCNVVLAMAGGPVRARRLHMEPLRPGASIQLSDSLAGGISRFYAEILRLRQIVEMASQQPRLLFLLDEIMAGTNSHDRRIGAAAIIRSLVQQKALGLVTTHDLALTEIVSEFPAQAANVHLEDQLVDGKMSFDYRLREGVVERSNAIELMRSVGLPI